MAKGYKRLAKTLMEQLKEGGYTETTPVPEPPKPATPPVPPEPEDEADPEELKRRNQGYGRGFRKLREHLLGKPEEMRKPAPTPEHEEEEEAARFRKRIRGIYTPK